MAENILQCTSLTKAYGAFLALNDISLEIPRGKIIGLLGSNGSGKTTFMKLVAGLLTPDFGQLLVNGMPIGVETKKIVSYLPDKNYLPEYLNVRQVIELFNDFYDDFNIEKAYDMVKRLNLNPTDYLRAMSKGTKEKIQLILTMSRNAQLYLLDEPIGGVDPAARDYILNTIISNYTENATVIITTHLIADVEKILDEVFFIAHGQIVLNATVDDIRQNEGKSVDDLFREVFKC
ncbi:MAG: ABC transporter ATP-binding protein [Oscillospiraceae bacterium]